MCMIFSEEVIRNRILPCLLLPLGGVSEQGSLRQKAAALGNSDAACDTKASIICRVLNFALLLT